jgi:secreted PhoX family phosphatase
MAKDFDTMEDSNRSGNRCFHDVSDPARRSVLQLGMGAAVASLFAPLAGCSMFSRSAGSLLGFKGVPTDTSRNGLVVPPGYEASVIAPWGDPIGVPGRMPSWRPDAGDTAADQEVQLGMHHDGIHYFALDGSRRGLLVMNHEYTDDGLLHPDGMKTWTAAKVRKSQAAHGISVIEVESKGDTWRVVRPSRLARRFTAYTPFTLTGPAAGHLLLRTAADPDGRRVLGTLNNCASSRTPWGTYLAGEENWADYFDGGEYATADQRRWGLKKASGYRWAEHDARFDARRHPNEFHRFGWIVEIDPMDPQSVPVKRTALGRGAHEGAWIATTQDQRAVVYSGEDARFEYLYKFVSRDKIAPAGGGRTAAQANAGLLDNGTLHVARFEADGSGRWIPLLHGQGPLTPANGFADAAEVLIKTRQAADAVGATKMDRPEWLAIHPQTGEVYCSLTNNAARGIAGNPGPDAANPRVDNVFGQIVRWKENGDFDATTFTWNHLVLAGDPANARPDARGNTRGDLFACPDGLAFDTRGVLWVQTDVASAQLYKGELVNVGSNQMLACDVSTGEMRRFLTGPAGCEITGATWTPDGRTMFVNVQHPGEPPGERSDPDDPAKFSSWPASQADTRPETRPRSATVVIRKRGGGVIGS